MERVARCSLLFLIVFLGSASSADPVGFPGQEKPLKNSAVVQMVKGGLSDEVIIKKIRASETDFDLTADNLVLLRAAGVSNGVIGAMIEKQTVRSGAGQSAIPKARDVGTEIPAKPGEEPTRAPKVERRLTTLPGDTEVVAAWATTVSSQSAKSGDECLLQVVQLLRPQASAPLLEGSRLVGTIAAAPATRNFMGGRAGFVACIINKLVLPDGFETDATFPKSLHLGYWDFKKARVTKEPKNRIQLTKSQRAVGLGSVAGASVGMATGMAAISKASGAAGLAFTILPILKGPEMVIQEGVGEVFKLGPTGNTCETMVGVIVKALEAAEKAGGKPTKKKEEINCVIEVPVPGGRETQ